MNLLDKPTDGNKYFDNYKRALNFLLILFVGIVCYIRGCRQARFFLVGWSLFVLTTCCWLLYVLGVTPYSIIVAHIQLLGSFVEATFLSLALADRFYPIKNRNR